MVSKGPQFSTMLLMPIIFTRISSINRSSFPVSRHELIASFQQKFKLCSRTFMYNLSLRCNFFASSNIIVTASGSYEKFAYTLPFTVFPIPKYWPPVRLSTLTSSRDSYRRWANAILVGGPKTAIPIWCLCY